MEELGTFSEKKNRLLDSRIVGIIRVDSITNILKLVQAIVDGGITTLEISLNTKNAYEAIKRVSQKFEDSVFLGAGTVTTVKEAKLSIHAGAKFIVTPISSNKVLKYCKRFKTPVCMGAFSPTEIFNAHRNGATLVKAFPADNLGIKYIKNVAVPLPKIPLMPTGGVNAENISEWFAAGAKCVGISSALFSQEDYRNEKFENITERTKLLVEKVKMK